MSRVLGFVLILLGWLLTSSPVLGFGIPLLDTLLGPVIGLVLIIFGMYNLTKKPKILTGPR